MLGANSFSDSSFAAQQACDELSRKLRAGEECRAEDFLEDQPKNAADSDAILELLYTEFIVREQLGQQPQPQAWLKRFPQWREELLQIFEVHALVDGGDTHTEGQPGTQREPLVNHSESSSTVSGQHTIGGYEILEEIGRGGMGIVYRAKQHGLGRIVALKMILSPHDERQRARFRAEAEATARLSHPNIVPIYEVGQHDGCPFLSIEFIAGPSLEKHLAKAVLAPRAAADLLCSLATAVAYAHEQGIIHRDLKPANVLLSVVTSHLSLEENMQVTNDKGLLTAPKITDFGLAKILDDGQPPQQSLAIVGTPSYMPPEQCAAGGTVGPAVDVYALGAILYEALTGRPPFSGSTALDILERVRTHEPVPPSQLAANIPRDLETICLKCLSKQPEQRYASAQDLAADLQRFLADEPIRARPIGRIERTARWCRRNPLVAALVGGIALLLIGGTVVSTSLAVWAFHEKSRANQHAEHELAARELAEHRFTQAEQAVGKYLDGIEDHPRLKETDFYDLRKELLASAVPFYEEFVASKPGDAELEAKRGRAYGRLGFIRKQMGALEQATADYEQMRDIFSRLSTVDEKYRRELAESLHQLGWTLSDRGLVQAAESEYQRSLDVYRQLAADFPEEHAHGHRVALGYRALGLLWSTLSRRAAAEQALRESLTRLEKLVAEHPDVVRYQEDMAGLHTFLANVLPSDDQDAREAQYRQSVELYKQLVAKDPNSSQHRFGLATARNNLGTMHTLRRRNDAALAELEQALELRKQIAAEFPTLPQYQQLLAIAHKNLGYALKNAKRPEDAEQELQVAITILKQTAANFSDNPEHRRQLAHAHEEQASVLQMLGKPAEAERELHAALQIRQQLAETFPAVPSHLAYLASCHGVLASHLFRVDRFSEAESEFQSAIEWRNKLTAMSPGDTENHRLLALDYDDLAQVLEKLRRRPEAYAAHRTALALWQDQRLNSTTNPAHLAEAGRGIANFATLLQKAGEYDESRKIYLQAAEIQSQAIKAAPANLSYPVALWNTYFQLASLGRQLKDHAATADIARTLADVRPTNSEDAVWAARYFGRCVVMAQQDLKLTESEREDLAHSYADRAMEFLHEAVRRGYQDTANLPKLDALAPLFDRPDFQKLVSSSKSQ
jgi:serine/threonine protein kinase